MPSRGEGLLRPALGLSIGFLCQRYPTEQQTGTLNNSVVTRISSKPQAQLSLVTRVRVSTQVGLCRTKTYNRPG